MSLKDRINAKITAMALGHVNADVARFSDTNYTSNPSFWFKGDVSAISVNGTLHCTVISPMCVIASSHATNDTNDAMIANYNFRGYDGIIYPRTIIASSRVYWIGDRTHHYDLKVGLLNTPLPKTVVPTVALAPGWEAVLDTLNLFCLCPNQDDYVALDYIETIYDPTFLAYYLKYSDGLPSEVANLFFATRGNDSGSSRLIPAATTLNFIFGVLNGFSSGQSIVSLVNAINRTVLEIGGTSDDFLRELDITQETNLVNHLNINTIGKVTVPADLVSWGDWGPGFEFVAFVKPTGIGETTIFSGIDGATSVGLTVYLDGTNHICIGIYPDPTGAIQTFVSTVAVDFSAARWIRVSGIPSTGSSLVFQFFTSNDGETWTQLGATLDGTPVTPALPFGLDGIIGNRASGSGFGFRGDIYHVFATLYQDLSSRFFDYSFDVAVGTTTIPDLNGGLSATLTFPAAIEVPTTSIPVPVTRTNVQSATLANQTIVVGNLPYGPEYLLERLIPRKRPLEAPIQPIPVASDGSFQMTLSRNTTYRIYDRITRHTTIRTFTTGNDSVSSASGSVESSFTTTPSGTTFTTITESLTGTQIFGVLPVGNEYLAERLEPDRMTPSIIPVPIDGTGQFNVTVERHSKYRIFDRKNRSHSLKIFNTDDSSIMGV